MTSGAESWSDSATSLTVDPDPTPDEPLLDPAQQARAESEIGDILFVIANIARRWQINPEEALRSSNRKFIRRFQHIERRLAEQEKPLNETSLREMEDLYQEARRLEKERG